MSDDQSIDSTMASPMYIPSSDDEAEAGGDKPSEHGGTLLDFGFEFGPDCGNSGDNGNVALAVPEPTVKKALPAAPKLGSTNMESQITDTSDSKPAPTKKQRHGEVPSFGDGQKKTVAYSLPKHMCGSCYGCKVENCRQRGFQDEVCKFCKAKRDTPTCCFRVCANYSETTKAARLREQRRVWELNKPKNKSAALLKPPKSDITVVCGHCGGCQALSCADRGYVKECVLCKDRRGTRFCCFRICETYSDSTKRYCLSQQRIVINGGMKKRPPTEKEPERSQIGRAKQRTSNVAVKECRNPKMYKAEWWEGNGIDKSRLTVFKGKIRQCNDCDHCREPPCGICGLCRHFVDGSCVFRCCEANSREVYLLYYDEIDIAFARVDRGLTVGKRGKWI